MKPRTREERAAYVEGINDERERILKCMKLVLKHNWKCEGRIYTLGDIALELEKMGKAVI